MCNPRNQLQTDYLKYIAALFIWRGGEFGSALKF